MEDTASEKAILAGLPESKKDILNYLQSVFNSSPRNIFALTLDRTSAGQVVNIPHLSSIGLVWPPTGLELSGILIGLELNPYN